jgi:acetoacetyl-CoA synthetase
VSGGAPLWIPDPARARATAIHRFRAEISRRYGVELPDYPALHRWSVGNLEAFWEAVWDFCGVIGERGGGPALVDREGMPGARFFPEARLNFAENLLRRGDAAPALIFTGEDGVRSELSFAELRARVGALARSLRALGLRPGERVAAYLPNAPETAIAMLATASLGGVFTSCSPDFGARGALERFAQVEPAFLLAADGYAYGGRRFDLREKVAQIRAGLPGLRALIGVRFAGGALPEGALDFADLTREPEEPRFERFAFGHPLYVLYSSGTTGAPKCIVHGAGGTLLQHLKEQRLHTDLGPGDRLFYFTTCGWMMWNWLMSGLACEASLVLYDGSPFEPGPERLFDLAQRERVTVFGTSARYIDSLAKSGLRPIGTHDLSSVKAILSTGSPLSPESFRFVYEAIKRDVCLSSISGGTDLIGCFAAGDPAGPVYAGEAQALALGMDVAAFYPQGRPLHGERGELVCRRPFPSMPLGFWGDRDGSRYRAAYFERFPGCWHHGDWIEITPNGGMVIYGRSDAVLNPGGVRIGTAEIYRPVERIEEVAEALVIGQDWQGDVRIVLFVRLREGARLDPALEARIRDAVRREASPRHVPARILAVPDIPRTRSGKIVELAVRDVVHGRPLANLEALANPEALEHFRDRPELGS